MSHSNYHQYPVLHGIVPNQRGNWTLLYTYQCREEQLITKGIFIQEQHEDLIKQKIKNSTHIHCMYILHFHESLLSLKGGFIFQS